MTTTHHSFVHIQDDGPHEEEHSPKQEVLQTIQKINFCIPRCSACKYDMQFIEGDIIYGDKWYHNSCWKDIEKIMEFVPH